ncbi:hypothetical protein L345_17171, partial [Ophiophagus hannah]
MDPPTDLQSPDGPASALNKTDLNEAGELQMPQMFSIPFAGFLQHILQGRTRRRGRRRRKKEKEKKKK